MDVQAQAALFLFFGRVFSAAGYDRPVGSGPCGRAGPCGERPGTARRNAADLVKSDSEEMAWTNLARAVLGHCSLSDQSSAPVVCRTPGKRNTSPPHEGRLKGLLVEPLSRLALSSPVIAVCARSNDDARERAKP